MNTSNIVELANNISYLLDNLEKLKELSNSGRNAVCSAFKWKIQEEKLVKLYEELFPID